LKYKLLQNNIEIKENDNWTNRILKNRGIEDVRHYLNTSDNDINDFLLLGEDKLKKGGEILILTIYSNKDAVVVVDSDCDGMTSAAVLNLFYAQW
jgi:single-stranded DNA-specific DHH superfamily exonuclease